MQEDLPDCILTKLYELLPRREGLLAATYEKRCKSAAYEIALLARIVCRDAELVAASTPRTICQREEMALRKFARSLNALATGLSLGKSDGTSNLLCSALTAAGRDPEAMREELEGMYWNVLGACADLPYPAELSRQMLMDALGWVCYDLTRLRRLSSSETSGFPAFAYAMFEAMQMEAPDEHLIQTTCEFITRELEARQGL